MFLSQAYVIHVIFFLVRRANTFMINLFVLETLYTLSMTIGSQFARTV